MIRAAWRRLRDEPDPAALAAGLVATRVGNRWQYRDLYLTWHLADRHAVWGPTTTVDVREQPCRPPSVSWAASSGRRGRMCAVSTALVWCRGCWGAAGRVLSGRMTTRIRMSGGMRLGGIRSVSMLGGMWLRVCRAAAGLTLRCAPGTARRFS